MSTKKVEYARLVTAHSEDLYRYAIWLCKDPTLAQDLTQETCLRAWKSLKNLKDHKAAKSWLFTILRNEYSRQFARYRPNFSTVDLEFLEKKDTQNDTSTEAFALRMALEELAEEYREPLMLQVLGGFSCEEIGTLCGVSTGAVMTRLFRAKQKLRSILAPQSSDIE